MKSLLQFLIIVILTSTAFVAQAQYNGRESKVEGAMGGFLKTDFMIKFQDLKVEAESMAETFKRNQRRFSANDVSRVRMGYEKTARRFNQVLADIKNDFQNKEKLKMIARFPDMYADGLRADMLELSDYYASNFQQPIADATGNSIDGSPMAILLVELIKLSSTAVTHLIEVRKNARKYDDAYLNKHLMQNYAFKSWNEIGRSGGFDDGFGDGGFDDGGFDDGGFGDDFGDEFNNNSNNDEDFGGNLSTADEDDILNQGSNSGDQPIYDNINDFEFEDNNRSSNKRPKSTVRNTKTPQAKSRTTTRPSSTKKLKKPINIREQNRS